MKIRTMDVWVSAEGRKFAFDPYEPSAEGFRELLEETGFTYLDTVTMPDDPENEKQASSPTLASGELPSYWLSYHYDWSGFRVFEKEIDCLRFAVQNNMDAIRLPFGCDPREAVAGR